MKGVDIWKYRQPDHEIQPLFVERWSPRAMSGEAIGETELMSLFEAARWAPSSYNNQPWRFLYALRDSAHWSVFFSLLAQPNQTWAKNAAVLIVMVSKSTFDHNGKFARTHTFDAGAAWQNLALQGAAQGLIVHGMQGFDYERAKKVLEVPNEYTVEVMVAVGKPGDVASLPEHLREREVPSGRKPLTEIAYAGKFRGHPTG